MKYLNNYLLVTSSTSNVHPDLDLFGPRSPKLEQGWYSDNIIACLKALVINYQVPKTMAG